MDEILKKNLIAEFKMDRLSGEKQEEVFARIGTILLEGILTKVIPLLSNEEKVQFEKIVDGDGDNTAGELYAFLRETIPNFDEISAQEIAELKQDAFDVMSKIG